MLCARWEQYTWATPNLTPPSALCTRCEARTRHRPNNVRPYHVMMRMMMMMMVMMMMRDQSSKHVESALLPQMSCRGICWSFPVTNSHRKHQIQCTIFIAQTVRQPRSSKDADDQHGTAAMTDPVLAIWQLLKSSGERLEQRPKPS